MSSADPEKQRLLGGLSSAVGETREEREHRENQPKVHWANIFGYSTTTLIILYYAACSSTMLVINKV
jgi:hypothetical protein